MFCASKKEKWNPKEKKGEFCLERQDLLEGKELER